MCVWLERVLSRACFGRGWATGSPTGPLLPPQIKYATGVAPRGNLGVFSPLCLPIISIRSSPLFDTDVFQLYMECCVNTASSPPFQPHCPLPELYRIIASGRSWRERPHAGSFMEMLVCFFLPCWMKLTHPWLLGTDKRPSLRRQETQPKAV